MLCYGCWAIESGILALLTSFSRCTAKNVVWRCDQSFVHLPKSVDRRWSCQWSSSLSPTRIVAQKRWALGQTLEKLILLKAGLLWRPQAVLSQENRGKTPDNWGHATNLMRAQWVCNNVRLTKKSRDYDLAPVGSKVKCTDLTGLSEWRSTSVRICRKSTLLLQWFKVFERRIDIFKIRSAIALLSR